MASQLRFKRLLRVLVLPLLCGACAHHRDVVVVHPNAFPDVETVAPRVLSSPVDCVQSGGGADGGVCEGVANAVLVCAHGTATLKTSSTVGWRVTDEWLKVAGRAVDGNVSLRCALGDQQETAADADDDTDGLHLPLAMPVAAVRWLSVARALDDFAVDPAGTTARPWSVLNRREQLLDRNADIDGGEAQTKATRITTQWRSGTARCTTVAELFRDRAMSGAEVSREVDGGMQEDASSMDWLESSVTGVFGLKIASHPQLGFVLEAFHQQSVQSGLRAGLFVATKLTCSASTVEALAKPAGFEVSLRPTRTGRAWLARARPRAGG